MRKQTADQMTRLLVRLPRKRTLHQPTWVVEKRVERLVTFLPIRANQFWLVVKRIDMTNTTAGKNLYDALDLWLKGKGWFLSVSACIFG